jgi:hypothetical protein
MSLINSTVCDPHLTVSRCSADTNIPTVHRRVFNPASSSGCHGSISVRRLLVFLPLDPRFAGSNPAEAMDF